MVANYAPRVIYSTPNIFIQTTDCREIDLNFFFKFWNEATQIWERGSKLTL
jgi:hypothetical protein